MKLSYSIVCPVYNEEHYILDLIEFLFNVKNLPEKIIIIDGKSTDSTKSLVIEAMKEYKNIILLDNENRTVPYALNLAIPLCQSDIVVRLDAHTKYADDYFDKIIESFQLYDADIVGGPMRITSNSNFQEAVGVATTTSFGIGNSSFHFADFKGYTESVYLGAWKLSVFERIGLFDINFKRNQDDEFHYRAIKYGLKIFQNPEIKLWYYPRSTFKRLFLQYFEYGLYKPMVLSKIKGSLKLRHLIPSFFVMYLILVILFTQISFIFLLPLILYIFVAIVYILKCEKNIFVSLLLFLIYPTLHISYGTGFLIGLKKLRKRFN